MGKEQGDDRVDPRLLAGVEAMLGGGRGEHPASGELVALAAGELESERAAELQEHLSRCEPCKGLLTGADAGLEEVRQIEGELSGDMPGRADFLPLLIEVPQRYRALAAGGTGKPAPAPEDRRVLLDQPPGLKAVYFRQAGRGRLGIFGGQEAQVALDGTTLQPEHHGAEEDGGGLIYDLGPVGELPGAKLELDLSGSVLLLVLVEDKPSG